MNGCLPVRIFRKVGTLATAHLFGLHRSGAFFIHLMHERITVLIGRGKTDSWYGCFDLTQIDTASGVFL